MSGESVEKRISYQPTEWLSYDPSEEKYWDAKGLREEVVRAFEICHGCRMCFKYCDSFPTLFSLIDEQHGGDVRRLTEPEVERVMDACFQCKLCEVQCPYTPRDGHEFQLDFPKLVHRHDAVKLRARGKTLRERVLGDPDRAARAARASLGLANAANRSRPLRVLMEKTVGIHRDKLLPDFAGQPFDDWAEENGYVRAEPGGEVVLFQTCFVQHNEPQLGKDALEVLRACQVDARVVKGLACCGMPAWEHGDLDALRRQARRDLDLLLPYVDAGAKVLVVNPTCSMMMRKEWPHLLEGEDRSRAARLAAAVRDPSEFLWSIRDEPRFVKSFRSVPPGGKVAYHAPCHLRAQGVGFKGRDLLRRIPGVTVAATVMECCGHDGTYAMTVEGFGPSQRIGKKAFDGMKKAEARVWATDCPLAALQFAQHAGRKPLHPLAILARATRPDGFADLEEKE
ncbi:heterodisulfide reductase-related iron-sulfur binding cluster [Anaeromyxobacter paludicola]|uniref:Fe-S oxidoreductase n=1 Tax=Anaeromyxobacter paludicola TaxID=2918171 RepID=A0ABN6NDR3_9BACT|nr:heterodisulfide reductase-related iron-sulfur binding cluster [Anaeromyxobacter paludicola]BDG10727.1 Fe-S oxidoreductase [Anaeromyxobacter paludicola]